MRMYIYRTCGSNVHRHTKDMIYIFPPHIKGEVKYFDRLWIMLLQMIHPGSTLTLHQRLELVLILVSCSAMCIYVTYFLNVKRWNTQSKAKYIVLILLKPCSDYLQSVHGYHANLLLCMVHAWAVFHKDCNCFNVYFLFQLQNLTEIISAVIDFKIPLHKIDLSWNN